MADTFGRLRRDLPHVERGVHELVAVHRRGARQATAFSFGLRHGPVEATLRRDDDPFGQVTQHRVGRPLEAPPCARSRRPPLLDPDDLAAQQQAQVVLEDGRDVGRERTVRATTQVGDVDGDATAGFQFPGALCEDVAQHLEVLEVRRRNMVGVELGLVGLAGEVRRRGDHQGDGAVGHLGHVGRAAVHDAIELTQRGVLRDRVVVGQLGRCESGVEVAGVVPLAPAHTEVRGRRRHSPLRDTRFGRHHDAPVRIVQRLRPGTLRPGRRRRELRLRSDGAVTPPRPWHPHRGHRAGERWRRGRW